MNAYESKVEQLELLSVKESNENRVPAKRVDIVVSPLTTIALVQSMY